jgi:hypothetical protein
MHAEHAPVFRPLLLVQQLAAAGFGDRPAGRADPLQQLVGPVARLQLLRPVQVRLAVGV